MKRCKDCKWFTWMEVGWVGTYMPSCLNIPKNANKYGSMSCIEPEKCQNYTRKWWKIWRSK